MSEEKRRLSIVKLDQINDEVYRMRSSFDDFAFGELVVSIRKCGVLVPVLLVGEDDGFVVSAGHRRVAAAKVCGLSEVPAYIIPEREEIGWLGAFAENIVRHDLSAVEEAAAVKDCIDNGVYDVSEMAGLLDRSVAWVRACLAMCEWPVEVLSAVHGGKLSVAAAGPLARIDDDTQRRMLTDYAVENGATARITAAWLQAWIATRAVADPGEISPAAGREGLPPIEQYTPCVICGDKQKMAGMTFAPVCSQCTPVIAEVARGIRDSGGPGGK